jgi:hypothetical protein
MIERTSLWSAAVRRRQRLRKRAPAAPVPSGALCAARWGFWQYVWFALPVEAPFRVQHLPPCSSGKLHLSSELAEGEGLPSTRNWPFRWPLSPTSPSQVMSKAMRAATWPGRWFWGVELHQRRHSRAAGGASASALLFNLQFESR